MINLEEARAAALEVLRFNAQGTVPGLPRTAGWGYPEPYTRDLMLSAFGILPAGDPGLVEMLRRVLDSLVETQSPLGQISSLAHDPTDLGSSDATPLFLIGSGLYRLSTGEDHLFEAAVEKAFRWMSYQRPDEISLVAQMPTSDWRDEQWVFGYGLYVNTLYYIALRLHHLDEEAERFRRVMNHFDLRSRRMNRRIHEGLAITDRPYFALWAYKMYNNERFDLLGNSLAVLSGLVTRERAAEIMQWLKLASADLRLHGELAVDLPPCLIPYIQHGDPDWYPRMEQYNLPGSYHNGGIWPFICGFYIAALIKTGEREFAESQLQALTELVRKGKETGLVFGFNEWYQAQTGLPQGQDWQTWSAAVYLYALEAGQQGTAPYFETGFPFLEQEPPAEGEHKNPGEDSWRGDLLS